jgi:class 3 adenylate cyclase
MHFSGGLGFIDRAWLDLEFSILRTFAPQTARNDVVIVGIDEDFLRNAPEPLALMHRHFSDLFEAVASAKPRLTGLDVVLPQKSFSFLVPASEPTVDFDRALARGLLSLGSSAPLVIGETWDNANSRFRDIHPAFVAAAGQWVLRNGPEGFDHRGSALVCPDDDGVVREYPDTRCQPGGVRRTLVGQMAALQERGSDFSGYIDYSVGGEFTYLPASQVVQWHRAGEQGKLSQLTNRTVLIGVILDNEDRLKSPVALAQWEPGNHMVPGVTLQAQMMRSIMNQGLVQPSSFLMMLLLILLASGFWSGVSIRLKVLLYTAMLPLLGAASLLALRGSLFVPVGVVLATATLSLVASAAVAGRRHWLERQYLTRTFSGYVSPKVLKGILSGALASGRAGQRQQVCVLFSDIRNFTTLSENLPADRVVELLNRYFESMSSIVHRHGGLVDKFIGDGMMTLFGVPQPLPCAEKSALEAAREMLLAVDDLNAVFRETGLPEIRIGIGLHSGEAVIGHLGSSERHEYTAIGDTVNVAARVCDLPKTLGYPIICTEAVAKAVGMPTFLEDAGLQTIKGHSDVRVFGWQPREAGAK